MIKITDEEVLATEMHITVEQYLRLIDRIRDSIIAYLDTSEQSEELELVKQNFKALFLAIRSAHFDGFKAAIVEGSAKYDGKIN